MYRLLDIGGYVELGGDRPNRPWPKRPTGQTGRVSFSVASAGRIGRGRIGQPVQRECWFGGRCKFLYCPFAHTMKEGRAQLYNVGKAPTAGDRSAVPRGGSGRETGALAGGKGGKGESLCVWEPHHSIGAGDRDTRKAKPCGFGNRKE